MKKAPVMLLFFNRPECLKEVFETIKDYKPDVLFLVQDGPRNQNEIDIIKINECRNIVSDENIFWECKVYRNYSDVNLTCDHREYTGISWCFEYVDELIVLEDDCVPSQSFYHLCEECLDRYKDNTNIHSIYGFNRVGSYDCPYDYVFSTTGAGWGWATWKRVWNKVEELQSLKILEDENGMNYFYRVADREIFNQYGDFRQQGIKIKQTNSKLGIMTSWEFALGIVQIMNNMISITPRLNLIKYIGISENATHTESDPRLLSRKMQKLLLQPAYEMKEPFNHPPFIVRDTEFEIKSRKAWHQRRKIVNVEALIRRALFMNPKDFLLYLKEKGKKYIIRRQ